jgi:hypothetical protein
VPFIGVWIEYIFRHKLDTDASRQE